MRIKYICLVNYKRLYNGTGLAKVEYDFPDMYNVVKISGNNGSGKSSLLRFLNPFPDAPSEIISDREGSKTIIIEDDNTKYVIEYTYKNGKTLSASINSSVTGELNPSGNIVSAKEIVSNLFSLDPGFETLSLLTGYDKKSIAMMRPSERKAFISSLLQNLDAYTNIYKTLSKRSSIFKAMIQSLNSKIDSIGSIEQIEETYKNLLTEIDSCKTDRDNLIIELGSLNITEELAEKAYDDSSKLEVLKRDNEKIMQTLHYLEENYIRLSLPVTNISISDGYKAHESLLEKYEASKNALQSQIDFSNKSCAIIKEQLDLLANEKRRLETDDIIQSLDKYVGKVNEISEAESHIDTLRKIWTLFIDTIYKEVASSNIPYIVKQLDILKEKVSSQYCLRDYRTTQDCQNLITPDGKYNPEKVIEFKHLYYGRLSDKVVSVDRAKQDLDDIDYSIMYSKDIAIRKHIDDQVIDLIKPILDIVDDKILNLSMKIEDIDTSKLLSWYDDCVVYNKYKTYLDDYYHTATNENKRKYAKIRDQIEDLIKKMESLMKDYKEEKDNITKNNKELIRYDYIIENLTKCMNMVLEYEESSDKLNTNNQKISVLENTLSNSEKYYRLCKDIHNLNTKISSLENTAYRYKYSLDMLEEYIKEMAQYQQNFKFTETLKKYCSPSTGIQLIFVELYMNKILSMANSLLSRLFKGEFILQKFVISDSEFRIPVQGNGLLIDDISSMSSSQIAMINMCISFAILAHTSTKYRIIRLDELDSPLDNMNRTHFSEVLEEVMKLLNCEQCFVISHNTELVDSSFQIINIGR